MIRILIASRLVTLQEAVIEAIETDGEFTVAGIASTGRRAAQMACELRPDIVTMGWRIHKEEGAAAAAEIMTECPTPVVVIAEPELIKAGLPLDSGELAVIHAPIPGDPVSAAKFLSQLKAMSQVKVVRRFRGRKPFGSAPDRGLAGIVAIAASTGGPAALKAVLEPLPADFPVPLLAVQHISEGFVDGVASWLDAEISMKVRIAASEERMAAGTVYLAPDGNHLGVMSRNRLLLSDAPPVKGFRPSGTFLFESVAQAFGTAALAVVLTGMGDDGLQGALAVHEGGGTVIAQDEESSVIFGMPKAVIEAGVADLVMPLNEIAGEIALRTGLGALKKKPRQ